MTTDRRTTESLNLRPAAVALSERRPLSGDAYRRRCAEIRRMDSRVTVTTALRIAAGDR